MTSPLRAILVLLALTLSAAPALADKVCKDQSQFGRSAVLPNQDTAVDAAIVAWSAKVSLWYTPSFANYSNAADATQECEIATSFFGLNGWRCIVQATPCRFE